MKKIFEGFLSGNQLKLIAIIATTLDHIGVQILTVCLELCIIGRLAFSIFAYMISERDFIHITKRRVTKWMVKPQLNIFKIT